MRTVKLYNREDLIAIIENYEDKWKDIDWCVDTLKSHIEDTTKFVHCGENEEIDEGDYLEYERSVEVHTALEGLLKFCGKEG